MMDDELENESDNEEEEEVEKVEEGEEEVEESEKGEEGEESEGPYSASDDDDAEDMNFDAPQWSWCGYTVDDDEFERTVGRPSPLHQLANSALDDLGGNTGDDIQRYTLSLSLISTRKGGTVQLRTSETMFCSLFSF